MPPIPRQQARFDERRNTSRVWPVPPDALPNALKSLGLLRRDEPDLVAWLEAGAPPIRSQDEHRRWFGCDYRPRERRRKR